MTVVGCEGRDDRKSQAAAIPLSFSRATSDSSALESIENFREAILCADGARN